jgi:hypothetical protein
LNCEGKKVSFAKGFPLQNRVTRLGVFLLFGRLFSLGSFFYITEGAHIFGLLFLLEPILRFFNLQLQRQRCCRLDRFSLKKKILLCSKRVALQKITTLAL